MPVNAWAVGDLESQAFTSNTILGICQLYFQATSPSRVHRDRWSQHREDPRGFCYFTVCWPLSDTGPLSVKFLTLAHQLPA